MKNISFIEGSIKKMPLVTFALITYNQEKYIKSALDGALSQTYSPLEILISDDNSSDKTFEIIETEIKKYSGPHSITINRNKENLGLIGHVNKIFELAKGELIIAAAGDDISMPHRTMVLMKHYFSEIEKPLLMHSKAIEIDLNGNQTGNISPDKILRKNKTLLAAAKSSALYLGATGLWSKDLYKKYGLLRYKNSYEDLTLGFRAHLEGRIKYIDEALIYYRYGNGISTSSNTLNNFRDYIKHRNLVLQRRIENCQQRLDDFSTSHNNNFEIKNNLIRIIKLNKIRQSLLNFPRLIPLLIFKNPITFFTSALLETKVLFTTAANIFLRNSRNKL